MLERRTPVKARADRGEQEPKPALLRPNASATGSAPGDDAKRATSAGATAVKPAATKNRAGGLSPSSPEVKAGLLLSSLVFLLLTLVLAPFGIVPGWLPLLGVVGVGGVVVWLRRSAVAARQARAAKPVARRASATAPRERSETREDETAPKSRPAAPAAVTAKRSPLIADATVERDDAAGVDVEPQADTAKRAEAEVFDARAWAPVDVPRPTYTMKAKAEREDVAPAATVDEVDNRPLAAQYENAPVDEIPFDGMALDEDYDELPEVYRAG